MLFADQILSCVVGVLPGGSSGLFSVGSIGDGHCAGMLGGNAIGCH